VQRNRLYLFASPVLVDTNDKPTKTFLQNLAYPPTLLGKGFHSLADSLRGALPVLFLTDDKWAFI
jgi:hypothetical protein